MPLSTTNPPVEVAVPAFTVASQSGSVTPAVTTLPAAFKYSCVRVFAPGSCTASGISILAGSGTATVRVFLTDAGGNVLASSAAAGTLLTASVYNSIPFTSAYQLVGPAAFYIVVQGNAATSNGLMTVQNSAATAPPGLVGGVSVDTAPAAFGTPVGNAITVPTTYTTQTVPIASLY